MICIKYNRRFLRMRWRSVHYWCVQSSLRKYPGLAYNNQQLHTARSIARNISCLAFQNSSPNGGSPNRQSIVASTWSRSKLDMFARKGFPSLISFGHDVTISFFICDKTSGSCWISSYLNLSVVRMREWPTLDMFVTLCPLNWELAMSMTLSSYNLIFVRKWCGWSDLVWMLVLPLHS